MAADVPEALGIDIGGTKMLGVVVDPRRPDEVIRSTRRPTPQGGDALLDAIEELVDALRVSERTTVGVGIPGLVDRDDRFRAGANLPGVVDLAVGGELRTRLGCDVMVDNDATCATAAEFRIGAGLGRADGVLFTIGTGIGGGLVLDGRVRHGAHGFAGEAGHMSVDAGGPRCPCGRRGCWELYASGSGLGRLAREAATSGKLPGVLARAGGDADAVRGEHVVAAARSDDPDVAAVLDRFAWWLAVGITNVAVLVDPSVVVLGGGVMEDGDLVIDRVRRSVAAQAMAGRDPSDYTIELAQLGPEAGAIGAAILGSTTGRLTDV